MTAGGLPAALIFDVDGTLAETEEAHRRAFNETFAEAGLPWHWDRALYRVLLRTTGGKERMRAYLATLSDAPGLSDAEIAGLHARKTARYGEIVAGGGLDLRPGIADIIAAAREAGLRLAVATTTNAPNVDALIRATLGVAATEVFEVIAAGDMVARKKPAPDVYLLALERLGLPPGRCLALEDSRNGLLSAQAAGLACLVSPGPYTEGEDFTGATALIESFADLVPLDRLASLLARVAA